MAGQEQVCIVGAGTMGHSIALNFAWKGFDVTVCGQDEADLQSAGAGILSKLKVMLAEGLIGAAEQDSIFDRIRFLTDLREAVAGKTCVIEAAPELIDLKQELFRMLEELCSGDTLIASNTSGLAPSLLSEKLRHPGRFLVMHFWNPAHLIPLVEVVPSKHTAALMIDRAFNLLKALGKKPILVKKEVPGFISNRLQFALLREAEYPLENGVASQEDIDTAVTQSIGRRLPVTGPFLSADMGGLDLFEKISRYLYPDLSNADEPSPSMTELVAAGRFGEKSGAGFYEWKEDAKGIAEAREKALIHFLKMDQQAG